MAESIDVAGARNEVFNIGTDTPCTLNDLTGAVATAMGVTADVVHLAPRLEVQQAVTPPPTGTQALS